MLLFGNFNFISERQLSEDIVTSSTPRHVFKLPTFMKKIESILTVIILTCLCVLAWASAFILHNLYVAAALTIGLLVWLWSMETKQ